MNESPANIAARARAQADAGDVATALSVLLLHRGNLKRVPPFYDILVGQLFLRDGNAAQGADYLLLARDALGDAMPLGARRDLAMALLESRRVETAGREFRALLTSTAAGPRPAWVSRPACLSAIEAFNNSATSALDTGPATPYRIVAQAEVLAESGDAAAGAALLHAHRENWESLPPGYDAARQRLSAASRDWQADIKRLSEIRDTCPGLASADLRLSLGAALFETGRIGEAGREFDQAAAMGAAIDRLEWKITIDLYRRRMGHGDGFDTSFSQDATLVDPEKRIVYVAIPKNACTELKANFVLNSCYSNDFRASRKSIHDYCGKLTSTSIPRDLIMRDEYFRFVVLRDPFRRLVSAYLNKIVRPRRNRQQYLRLPLLERTIRKAQQIVGIGYDPIRSITFEEFVNFLAQAEDTECNRHWMPQFRFSGTNLNIYHHVGVTERLSETIELLSERFAYVWELRIGSGLLGAASRFTRYSSSSELADPFKALPDELDRFEENIPEYTRFYSPKIRQIVAQRYATDVALHHQAGDVASRESRALAERSGKRAT